MTYGIRPQFATLVASGFGSLQPNATFGFSPYESIVFDPLRLLGPLVTPPLKNPDGVLDLNQIPTTTGAKLQPLLVEQTARQRPLSAHRYQPLLSATRFSPLFDALWDVRVDRPVSLPIEAAASLSAELSTAIFMVEAASFRDRYPASSWIDGIFRHVVNLFKPKRLDDHEGEIDFNAALQQHEYHLEMDRELQFQLHQALGVMDQRDLSTYVQKVRRFNDGPVHICGTFPGVFLMNLEQRRKVWWYNLRKDLVELPRYFDLTRALGLSYAESIDLLFSTVDAIKYDSVATGEILSPFIDILSTLRDSGFGIREDLPPFYAFLAVAKKYGDFGYALQTVNAAVKAGVPLHRSLELVIFFYENAAIPGYAFMELYNALDQLRANDLEGEALFQALMHISGSDPYYARRNYALFTELMDIVATQTLHEPRELLWNVNQAGDHSALAVRGTIASAEQGSHLLAQAFGDIAPRAAVDSSSIVVKKSPERYFPRHRGTTLVHGRLPYRLEKGYEEGLKDLRALTENEFSEGAWIYDREGAVWYSLGGRTLVENGRVRFQAPLYDLFRLGRRLVFVHIHPQRLETVIAPPRGALAMPQFQKKLTSFYSSMPSGADLQCLAALLNESSQPIDLEAIIVTPLGITQIAFPNDAQQLKELGARFSALKDEAVLRFNARRYHFFHGIREEDRRFVQRLVRPLNRQLPEGFEITLRTFEEHSSYI